MHTKSNGQRSSSFVVKKKNWTVSNICNEQYIFKETPCKFHKTKLCLKLRLFRIETHDYFNAFILCKQKENERKLITEAAPTYKKRRPRFFKAQNVPYADTCQGNYDIIYIVTDIH